MTTTADLIHDTRWHLMTGHPDVLNVLDTTIDAITDTLTLRYELRGVSQGTILCVGVEEMHVISTSGSAPGSTVTVLRGFNGSTAAAHTADDITYVSPQFSDFRILRAINKGLENLSNDLFRIKSVQFSYTPARAGYELTPTDLIDVWRVSFDIPGPTREWPFLPPEAWYVDLAADTATFPSGKQLVLRYGGSPGFPVKVSYRAAFSPLVSLTDDVLAVSGLHTEAHDLPALFAGFYLSTGREVKRSFTTQQPERRRQEEVPPGAARMGTLELMELYERRINEEKSRLIRRYPGAH